MIYFGADLRQGVLRKLALSLCPGGFLGLGPSERPAGDAGRSFCDFAPEERIFRRGC